MWFLLDNNLNVLKIEELNLSKLSQEDIIRSQEGMITLKLTFWTTMQSCKPQMPSSENLVVMHSSRVPKFVE